MIVYCQTTDKRRREEQTRRGIRSVPSALKQAPYTPYTGTSLNKQDIYSGKYKGEEIMKPSN